MKVLHVIGTVDPRAGGPIAGVFSGAAVWARHGHQRDIVCFDPPDAPWVHSAPLKVFALGLKGQLQSRLERYLPWLRYGYTPRLTRWLKANAANYDAVIVNGLWSYASYGSWRSLHAARTPYFVFTHGMLDPWFNKAYPTKTLLKRLFWTLFEHKVLRDARGVMFTCEEERRLAAQSFTPYRAREYVVGYGTREGSGDPTVQKMAFLEKVPAAHGRKFILFLSRIHEKKGVDLLIGAFARICGRFPGLDLVIAGPDDAGWGQHLRKLSDELGVSARIHWPGMLTGEIKWGAFGAAEFFVLPSHQENFGIVVAEALSMGKPVLITNKVNIWREVEQDGAGVVVNDDLDSIAGGLDRMCALPNEELVSMSRKARMCFIERFDMVKNAMTFQSLLVGLIDTAAGF